MKFPRPLGTFMLMARVLCFLSSSLTTTFRSRLLLQRESAALRHQLSTYRLKGHKARIGPADRLLWSVIAQLWSPWPKALFFLQPRTVIVWQHKRFREYWRALSHGNQPARHQVHRIWILIIRGERTGLWTKVPQTRAGRGSPNQARVEFPLVQELHPHYSPRAA